MDYRLKQTNYELRDFEVEYLEKKLRELERFLARESNSDTHLAVEIAKDAHHWKGPRAFYAEFTLSHEGRTFRAEGYGETPQAAIDEAKDELMRQWKRERKRHLSLVRRGARKVKEWLRGFGG